MEQIKSEANLSLSNMIILGRLGRGGTSHVFKAQSTKNKKLYAMKVIDKKAKNYSLSAFQRELKIHSGLFNPFIVRLEGHFQDSDNHYVLTEYCEGGQMTKLINQDLSQQKLANIIHQIALGLSYLHKQGIAHCDLKLSNMLLHKGHIKLCDFGFSQLLYDVAKEQKSLCGTIYYMAPETLKEKKRIHHKKGDIWAFGISLLVLITKKQPYTGDNFQVLRKQIIAGEHQKIPELSSQLYNLMQKMLKMNPIQRLNLDEIISHPFLQKYHSQLNFEITIPKISIKQKKINDKMQQVSKLTSESQSEDKQANIELYKIDPITQQPKQQNFKEWTFKRPENNTQVKAKNDCTIEKKINKNQISDNQKTIRNSKNKRQFYQHQKNIQSSNTQLMSIQASLITPFEQFFYQTKNDGFIKILKNGQLEIKVKNITFEIINNGENLRLLNKFFSLKQLNKNGCKGQMKQPYELYAYAKQIIDILISKKYLVHWKQKFQGIDLIFGISLDWKKIKCLAQISSKRVLLQWIQNEQFLIVKREGQKSIRILNNKLSEEYLPLFALMKNYLLQQANSQGQKQ